MSGMGSEQNKNIIILCENCSQKLRVPKRRKQIQVTCPKCRHKFNYRHNIFGLSSSKKKYLQVGFIGSIVGFLFVEIIYYSWLIRNVFLSSTIVTGVFGLGLGGVMGLAEGFFRKDKERMYYGLKVGATLGLISGGIAGLIAQSVFSLTLSNANYPSLDDMIFARTIGWCVLGFLIGGSYGIKENTIGDLKSGLIGGSIGGAIGGILFDPLNSFIQIGNGTFGRLVGFSVLGIAVSISINHFQEIAIKNNKREMYQQLTKRLPPNPRLLLPGSNKKPPKSTSTTKQEKKSTSTTKQGEKSTSTKVDKLRKNLLSKCLGDVILVDRLIAHERKKNPALSLEEAIQAAIERWENDNR